MSVSLRAISSYKQIGRSGPQHINGREAAKRTLEVRGPFRKIAQEERAAVMCGIRYERNEWELAANNVIVHRPIGVTFLIKALGDTIEAIVIDVNEPDRVLSDDVEELKPLAVRAYWDAIGFGQTALIVDGPKPS